MCGIFGIINYGGQQIDMKELTELLGIHSSVRGEDATGISYVEDGKLKISKNPVSAYDFTFVVPDGIKVVMGHTRQATTGDKNQNFNNHPFRGNKDAQTHMFALAHNGVINNVQELRNRFQIGDPKVKTDTYIAVQLIEHCGGPVDFRSLRFMAENVRGMFTFTVLDDNNSLYFVKGDSPLFILHFKRLGMYVYASTTRILFGALIDSGIGEEIYDQFRDGFSDDVVLIEPEEGEIIKVDRAGRMSTEKFEHTRYSYAKTRTVYKNYDCDEWGCYGQQGYYGGRSIPTAPATAAPTGASTASNKSIKDVNAESGGSTGGNKGEANVDATKSSIQERVAADITTTIANDKAGKLAIPPATVPPGPSIKPANIPPATQSTLSDTPTVEELQKMSPTERAAWEKKKWPAVKDTKVEEGKKAIGAFAGDRISDIALRESK